MLGREVRLSTEIMFGLGTSHVGETVASYSEFVDHLKSRMQRAYELARSHLGVVAEREKWKHDFKLNLKRYHQGNLVWVRTDKNQLHITPKLRCAYQIPYLVLHRVNDLDYVIQLDAEGKRQLIHHGRLKPYEGQVRLLSGPKRHSSSTGTHLNIPWIKWWMNDWVIHVTYLVHPWFQFPNCVKVNSEDNCLWIWQEKAVLLMQCAKCGKQRKPWRIISCTNTYMALHHMSVCYVRKSSPGKILLEHMSRRSTVGMSMLRSS